ncbi:hypothetical protein HER10_EVM0011046 [Colletotrichum scovillei]|uniref:uncharacterized protein n=1 Tax=Colletotrichum scovillei TaxID=1209932 RepID=UPI0015C325CD|nr:uncharacterized protein HER10_EVM0011046 [Colletotrichum scovillei]KAF4777050.1 hypothetical protein HER10_EVM0011046 [Colletotrichum scovillei]
MTSPQPPRDDSKTAGLAGIPIPTELVLQIVKAIGPRPKPQPAKHIRLHGALEAEADSDSDDLEIVDNYFYEDPNKPTQPDVLEGITDLKNLTITCRALYQMLRGVLYQRSGQEDDWYALRWASFNGNLRALEAAVEAGASVNYAFEKAGTPIDMMNYGRVESTFGSNFPMLQRSKTYNFGTPLLAAAYGDVTRRHQAIKWLLSHGADPNTTDANGITPLHVVSHITDIFSLATTSRAVLSASGSSTLHIHDTADPTIPITQSISGAHKLGCHHICTSRNGLVAASAGFAGEVKIWVINKDTSEWKLHSEITNKAAKAGEVWAIALSEDGKFLAGTTYDGRVNVWDVGEEGTPKIREYETGSPGQGSFGMSVDLSRDGRYTASGHQNGAVYVFNNDNGKLLFSLPGLVKSVRSVAFSPGNTRLAAAGDSSVIALYDIKNGEQVSNMTGHSSWITSVDWNDTGEYLLSGAMDGKVKVWSVERSACVATHSETDKALWAVKWLPKTGKNESFCTAGANRSISFYREATGA